MRGRWRGAPVVPAVVALCWLLPASLSLVHAQTPLHVRGTVVRGGEMSLPELPPMIVRTDDGRELTVQVAINPRGADVRAVDARELGVGRYVGVIATGAAGGARHAHAVIVYPPVLAGTDEGEFPWDAPAASVRVNARIAAAAPRDGVLLLTLRVGDRDWPVSVDATTTVVAVDDAGGFHAYPPGAHVFIDATRQRDGRITAGRVYVGKDGLVPPM